MQTSQSRMRESTTKIFLDAFKQANDSSNSTILVKLANELEESIFNIVQNDSSKEYRDQINFFKMKLKGSHNSFVRSALYASNITPEIFVSLSADQINSEFFSQNFASAYSGAAPLPQATQSSKISGSVATAPVPSFKNNNIGGPFRVSQPPPPSIPQNIPSNQISVAPGFNFAPVNFAPQNFEKVEKLQPVMHVKSGNSDAKQEISEIQKELSQSIDPWDKEDVNILNSKLPDHISDKDSLDQSPPKRNLEAKEFSNPISTNIAPNSQLQELLRLQKEREKFLNSQQANSDNQSDFNNDDDENDDNGDGEQEEDNQGVPQGYDGGEELEEEEDKNFLQENQEAEVFENQNLIQNILPPNQELQMDENRDENQLNHEKHAEKYHENDENLVENENDEQTEQQDENLQNNLPDNQQEGENQANNQENGDYQNSNQEDFGDEGEQIDENDQANNEHEGVGLEGGQVDENEELQEEPVEGGGEEEEEFDEHNQVEDENKGVEEQNLQQYIQEGGFVEMELQQKGDNQDLKLYWNGNRYAPQEMQLQYEDQEPQNEENDNENGNNQENQGDDGENYEENYGEENENVEDFYQQADYDYYQQMQGEQANLVEQNAQFEEQDYQKFEGQPNEEDQEEIINSNIEKQQFEATNQPKIVENKEQLNINYHVVQEKSSLSGPSAQVSSTQKEIIPKIQGTEIPNEETHQKIASSRTQAPQINNEILKQTEKETSNFNAPKTNQLPPAQVIEENQHITTSKPVRSDSRAKIMQDNNSWQENNLKMEMYQKTLDFAVQKQKVEMLQKELESLRKQNQQLKSRVNEVISSFNVTSTKQDASLTEQEKQLFQLESELRMSQNECKLIKEGNIRLVAENSKNKELFDSQFKSLNASYDELKQQIVLLRNQVESNSSEELKYLKDFNISLLQSNKQLLSSQEVLNSRLREKDEIIDQLHRNNIQAMQKLNSQLSQIQVSYQTQSHIEPIQNLMKKSEAEAEKLKQKHQEERHIEQQKITSNIQPKQESNVVEFPQQVTEEKQNVQASSYEKPSNETLKPDPKVTPTSQQGQNAAAPIPPPQFSSPPLPNKGQVPAVKLVEEIQRETIPEIQSKQSSLPNQPANVQVEQNSVQQENDADIGGSKTVNSVQKESPIPIVQKIPQAPPPMPPPKRSTNPQGLLPPSKVGSPPVSDGISQPNSNAGMPASGVFSHPKIAARRGNQNSNKPATRQVFNAESAFGKDTVASSDTIPQSEDLTSSNRQSIENSLINEQPDQKVSQISPNTSVVSKTSGSELSSKADIPVARQEIKKVFEPQAPKQMDINEAENFFSSLSPQSTGLNSQISSKPPSHPPVNRAPPRVPGPRPPPNTASTQNPTNPVGNIQQEENKQSTNSNEEELKQTNLNQGSSQSTQIKEESAPLTAPIVQTPVVNNDITTKPAVPKPPPSAPTRQRVKIAGNQFD